MILEWGVTLPLDDKSPNNSSNNHSHSHSMICRPYGGGKNKTLRTAFAKDSTKLIKIGVVNELITFLLQGGIVVSAGTLIFPLVNFRAVGKNILLVHWCHCFHIHYSSDGLDVYVITGISIMPSIITQVQINKHTFTPIMVCIIFFCRALVLGFGR